MKNLQMIVAVDQNMAIGRGGDQLAYISDDLKHFKATTQGHTVLMGRKTSDALPKGILPKRRNIVVTRDEAWQHEGAEVAHTIDEALQMCKADECVFVIGGGEIYKQCMPMAQRLVVTHIDHAFEGADTFFPHIDSQEWTAESESETYTDEKSGLRYRYTEYSRK